MTWIVAPAAAIAGELVVNGDKSVSHRSLLVGAICDGPVRVTGFGASADTLATLACVRACGVEVETDGSTLLVHGRGLRGLTAPAGVLDVANSGTLLRLLPGILVGQPAGRFVIDGDDSIRLRPIDRITDPLAAMGARVSSRNGLPPLEIEAGAALAGRRHEPAIASAQVKSCLLLAGLYADGRTSVRERRATRDHTERMLRAAGARIRRDGEWVSVDPPTRLALDHVEVPGDPSSAAFLVLAATLLPESRIFLRGIGVGPGRTGFLTVLERMGARVALFNRRTTDAGEPIADLEASHAELIGCDVEPELVPSLIDELPALALAASCARGEMRLRGLGELRHKESDRLATVRDALWRCGAHIEVVDDGWHVRGVPARLRGGEVTAHGDHRIAMLAAIAGLYSENGVRILDPECIDVSFPAFRSVIEGGVAAGAAA